MAKACTKINKKILFPFPQKYILTMKKLQITAQRESLMGTNFRIVNTKPGNETFVHLNFVHVLHAPNPRIHSSFLVCFSFILKVIIRNMWILCRTKMSRCTVWCFVACQNCILKQCLHSWQHLCQHDCSSGDYPSPRFVVGK